MGAVRERTSKERGIFRFADITMATLVVMVIGMMIIPMPTKLLDVLLSLNITFAVVTLLSTFYVKEALEIAAFPTILLLATLYRLALNVSTTRLILLKGYAGEVITAFGNFVVGGNYVVGAVVFLILVVIQFIVITKGAERVAEVAARFTLDAMPGKQMAIDADLNSGLIDESEARLRRTRIQREADFYGAMDGASKFVKGDAIAGLIITVINIIGGLTIGVFQRGLTAGQALQVYALLTVGDGLVAQIPALVFSTATGVIVTRAASETSLGIDVINSLTSNHRPLLIGAGLLFMLAIVPGLPFLPFAVIGSLLGFLGYRMIREKKIAAEMPKEEARREARPQQAGPENVLPLMTVEPMELEIGYALIPLVDPSQGGDMLERISTIRRQMALESGLIVPPIRIRDNIQLKPTEYVIKVRGVEVSRGELIPDHYLAINTSGVEEALVGIPTTDPAFGLKAFWISPEIRDKAEEMGFTVVDAPSVLATHLSEIIKKYGADLLSRQDVQKLIDTVKEGNPAAVEELLSVLSLGDIQKVLQNLLRESIPIRDLVTIFEALADNGRISRSVDFLTERVREALSRHITHRFKGEDGQITAMTLSPIWEQKIREALKGDLSQGWQLQMDPKSLNSLLSQVSRAMEKMAMEGRMPVLLVHPDVRFLVRKIIEGKLTSVHVLAYSEIEPGTKVRSLGTVE
jgi:flagellar biosynthesis protein FlhA